ncbi:TetR/AcrR family transcriptional regulator [Dactylosporangium sp. CA-092794]|uniref:TetR/AcrR family transcriptional regulator n=1 Tax=Dactylosporangium sp. CA-092794 TaxID=3239929 RepID=UPI003D8E0A78
MEGDAPRARRTGGRSARVRQAVHQAAAELIAERGYANFTVVDVAQRAGVADTSIYRRWGNLEALLVDVVAETVSAESPMPDTGTARGDLRAFAAKLAADIQGPAGLAMLRAVSAATTAGQAGQAARDRALNQRAQELQAMLDRARERGETTPAITDVVDLILSPLYIRVLFGIGGITGDYLDTLVDRACAA